ncbi:hypothetical protein CEXT_653621 [Caerostris extrusa]|uniref:Uncharacterized protein n=1 Tax=Caerostris extrusa TaxID=172846 RepID=A0AAV4N7Z8_CAEEX|nr:hypothetical protein CEXT_653621 [Caerostris extrusa]
MEGGPLECRRAPGKECCVGWPNRALTPPHCRTVRPSALARLRPRVPRMRYFPFPAFFPRGGIGTEDECLCFDGIKKKKKKKNTLNLWKMS